ncbi:hypothetical protein [Calothrix sp. NIES-2098]
MLGNGREARDDVVNNTLIQEVVRGYLWGNNVLREAHVIVATRETRELEK